MTHILDHKKHLIICILTFMFVAVTGFSQEKEQFQKESFIQLGDTLNYRILYPENFSANKTYPVLLFLHGAGERGSDNEKQLVHGSSLFLDSLNRKRFPAVVVFPQCPENDYWSNADVERNADGVNFKFQNGGKPTKALNQVINLLDSLKTGLLLIKIGYMSADFPWVEWALLKFCTVSQILSRQLLPFAAGQIQKLLPHTQELLRCGYFTGQKIMW